MFIKTTKTLLSAGLLAFAASMTVSAADIGKLTEGCADCHGKDGNSNNAEVPNIAGFSSTYLNDALVAYMEGDRQGVAFKKDGKETDMNKIAKKLSEEDIEALSEYYAKQTFKSHAAEQKTDSALVAKGDKLFDKNCSKCHEDFGRVADDDAGILGGQWMDYMDKQFQMFRDGERDMPKKMKKKFMKLSEGDHKAIIHALGSK